MSRPSPLLILAPRAAALPAFLPPRTPQQQAFLDQAYRAQQAQRFAPSEAQ
jgi:hypothetical protein